MLRKKTATTLALICCILLEGGLARAQVDCDQDFGDPDTSFYRLPYAPGKTYTCILPYCNPDPDNRHYGLYAYDFGMALADTVTAVRDGLVYSLRETDPNGTGIYHQTNFIGVEHADGTVCIYGHLTQYGALVEVGDVVAAGQPIALAGYSGLPADAPPCIHVEVLVDRFHWANEDARPFNFNNAQGPLDANRGLIEGEAYLALEPGQVTTAQCNWGSLKSAYR